MASPGLVLATLLSLSGPAGAGLEDSDAVVGTVAQTSGAPVLPNTAPAPRLAPRPGPGGLPLSFEANQGQTDEQVRFLSRGRGYVLYLTSAEAVVTLTSAARGTDGDEASARRLVLRMLPVASNPEPEIEGLDELPGKSHYLIGDDPAQWRREVSHYARVRYRQVYPGIDLIYHGDRGRLEYDFVVGPGADPGAIRLRFEGADELALDGHGNLVLRAAGGQVIQQAPIIYQEIHGEVREIAGAYVLRAEQEIGFQLADYDRDEPLVIDPVLVYSTYLGGTTAARATVPGSSVDAATDVALDPWGYVYVTGRTNAIDFPVTPGALQESFTAPAGGQEEAFVVKLDPAAADGTGSDLVWATYLGGGGRDFGLGIAVDGFGETYVTGMTESSDFPTVNPFQAAHLGGGQDVFVAKLNGAGSSLVYSTYLGSSGSEWGLGIAVNAAGQAHVTGMTSATGGGVLQDFPFTPGAFDETFNGNIDAFVTKFSTDGSSLLYSTFLGGVGGDPFSFSEDQGKDIAVDSAGNVYLVGSTRPLSGESFPTTPGAFQTSFGGGIYDLFVSQLDPAGGGASDLVYSTYLGGSGDDGEVGVLQNGWFGNGTALAVDDLGRIYVTASTLSADFPTVNAFQPAIGGATDRDAFVALLDPAAADGLGSDLVYSTYLGGSSEEVGYGIAVDGAGQAHVAGVSHSVDFPTVDPLQSVVQGVDAFVAVIDPSQVGTASVLFSTFLGGFATDRAFGIAADAAGFATVVGHTSSGDSPTTEPDEGFPTTAGSLREELGGAFSGFVAQIGDANQAPLANDDTYSLNEDDTLTVIAPGVLSNDSDGDGDTLTALLMSGPVEGELSLDMDGSFSYTPTADFNGTDGFTYVASDGEADSNLATVTFAVQPVNDSPFAVADHYTVDEDHSLAVPPPGVLGNDGDIDGDGLLALLISGPANGSLTLDPDGSFAYAPDPDFNGQDGFVYVSSDGLAASGPTPVAVDVLPVNDPPVAVDDSGSTPEDTSAVFDVLANDLDIDGNLDPLSLVLVVLPDHGTAVPDASGQLAYTPDPDYVGGDGLVYQICDLDQVCDQAILALQITPVNDPPEAAGDLFVTQEDIALTGNVLANDTDVDGDPLTASLTSGPSQGTANLQPDGTLDYTPAADFFGTDSLTYRVSDGQATSGDATVTITVLPVNDAPQLLPDFASTTEGVAVEIDVLANDLDPEGGSLTVTAVEQGAGGSVQILANGHLEYTPTAGFVGTDSFFYTAEDQAGDSAQSIVTVTVDVGAVLVAVDIKPTSCPNPLNPTSGGVVPVAILGSVSLDVSTIDPASIELVGLAPRRFALEDVATPYHPLTGRQDALDCTTEGPDGQLDLTLKFGRSDLVAAIEQHLGVPPSPGDVLVLPLSGSLRPEHGGAELAGEDVMLVVQ